MYELVHRGSWYGGASMEWLGSSTQATLRVDHVHCFSTTIYVRQAPHGASTGLEQHPGL